VTYANTYDPNYEPIEQAANPDRVIMAHDSRADATNVYADGIKVAEIFGVYPNELQVFFLAIFHASPKSLRDLDVALAINLRIGGIILLIP
jgi:hypothetical protein